MEIEDRLIGRRTFLTSLGFAGGTVAVYGYTPRLLAQSDRLETVSLGDFDLYYEVHGEGPPVVFAHGVGGTHLSWWQQIPAMSDHFQCVTFDHRGFGYSRDVGDHPGSEAFIDDLHALLDHLGIDRVGLIGQSMGGRTVLGFASAYPERVSALILCDTTGGGIQTRALSGCSVSSRLSVLRSHRRLVSVILSGRFYIEKFNV